MTYLLPPQGEIAISSEDFICKETQRTYNETVESPRLSAHAGDTVILMYLENGHVTKLDVNHNSSGIVQVFGTSTPSYADKFQEVTDGLNPGIYDLLQSTNFDDGQCYEDNGSPIALERRVLPQREHLDVEGTSLWCGNTVQIPPSVAQGSIYSLYWVWYFNTAITVQIYTTCLDIDIL